MTINNYLINIMTEYIFFYGHNPNEPYGCFSNFYPSNFTVDGKNYTCSEQYFMKKKQELFDPTNEQLANKIMETTNPASIKKFGRQVKNYNDTIWNTNRYQIMVDALKAKFNQNPNLKQILMSTGNKQLAETTSRDKIWAIGLDMNDPKRFDETQWKGQNLLGKALMEARASFI